MSDKGEKKLYTIDADGLKALIEAEVSARMTGAIIPDPLQKRIEEAARGQIITEAKYRCESPMTGARFTAVVQKSKAYPLGRIITVEDYEFPEGIEKHTTEGGLVPEGQRIFALDDKGRSIPGVYETSFRVWKTREFYIKDLTTWVGKPYQPSMLAREEADKRRAELAAQAAQ